MKDINLDDLMNGLRDKEKSGTPLEDDNTEFITTVLRMEAKNAILEIEQLDEVVKNKSREIGIDPPKKNASRFMLRELQKLSFDLEGGMPFPAVVYLGQLRETIEDLQTISDNMHSALGDEAAMKYDAMMDFMVISMLNTTKEFLRIGKIT